MGRIWIVGGVDMVGCGGGLWLLFWVVVYGAWEFGIDGLGCLDEFIHLSGRTMFARGDDICDSSLSRRLRYNCMTDEWIEGVGSNINLEVLEA